MKYIFFLRLSAFALLVGLHSNVSIQTASAERAVTPDEAAAEGSSEWYYGTKEETKSIARQKAELRAQQRMDRLASQKWYGFQPGRPTASGMPFTTMYSPAWSRPGGRPFSWYTGYPTVVHNHGYRYRW